MKVLEVKLSITFFLLGCVLAQTALAEDKDEDGGAVEEGEEEEDPLDGLNIKVSSE